MADPAETEDAERLVVGVEAKPWGLVEDGPLPCPDVAVGAGHLTGEAEQEREGHVGAGVLQDARRVGQEDAVAGRRGDVDVVGADGAVGYDFETRGVVQDLGVDGVDALREEGVALGGHPDDVFVRGRDVALSNYHVAVFGEERLDLGVVVVPHQPYFRL